MMLDMTRLYSLCFLFSSEIAANKKLRSFYGAGLNKNLKLNRRYYAFLRRNAMSEARPPKPSKASGAGSGMNVLLVVSQFLKNFWQIHHSMSDANYFNLCFNDIKNQPVFKSIHTPRTQAGWP